MPRKIDIDKSALVVGVDGKRAVLNNTGLGNYGRYTPRDPIQAILPGQ